MLRPMLSASNYKAFISYKHGASGHFAADLELALKEYAKPLLAPPIRIFRDEKYIVPDINLPKLITDALDASEYLLLLASPDAARSPWVHAELQHWCGDLKRTKELIVILLEGRIVIDPLTKQIDWPQTDALPPVLSEYLPAVPYYLDFTQGDYQAGTGLRHPAFRHAVNTIMARFRGVSLNDMVGIEVRQHRRNLKLRNAAISAVAIFGILAAVASCVASNQRNGAVSRLLASQALQPESRIDIALLSAVSAFETASTVEAESALRTLAFDLSDVERVFAGAEPFVAGASDTAGKYLAAGSRSGAISIWDLSDGSTVFEGRFGVPAPAAGIAFLSGQGAFVALSQSGELCVIDVPIGTSKCRSTGLDSILGARTARTNNTLVVWHGIGRFSAIDVNTLAVRTFALPGDGHDLVVVSWDLSPDGAMAIVGRDDGRVASLALADGMITEILPPGSPATEAIRFDSSGGKVALGESSGKIGVLDVSSGDIVGGACSLPTAAHHLAFVSGTIVGAALDGTLYQCSKDSSDDRGRRRSVQKGNVSQLLTLGEKGERVVLVSEDGTAVVRRISASGPIATLPGDARSFSRLAFSGNSRLLAGTDDGKVLMWDQNWNVAPVTLGQLGSRVRALAVSPDGSHVAFGGQDEVVTLLEVDGKLGTPIPVVGAPFDYATSAAFSPNSDVLAVGNAGGKLTLYEAGNGALIGSTQPNQHPNTMCCTSFDRSGNWLFTADNNGNVLARDASTGSPKGKAVLSHAGIIGGLTATDVRDEVLSVGMDGRVIITAVNEANPRCEVRHPDGSITLAAAHASAAPVFASVSRTSVAVWNSSSPCRLLFQSTFPRTSDAAVAISSDGSVVAWGTWESPISLLRIPESRALAKDLCRRVVLLDSAARRLPDNIDRSDCR